MPGSTNVVYEGLLNLVGSDDEVAVLVGHEVAHAVAKHSNERMSQQLLTQYGAAVLDKAVSGSSAAVQTVAGTVYGLGAQFGVMLPYSRKHEYEADHMGLIFMAIAGYNPDKAVSFWTKVSAASDAKVPEIMILHPEMLIVLLKYRTLLLEAKKYMKKKKTDNKKASS